MKSPLRVLIVDDSADDAELVVRALEHAGWRLIYERVDTREATQAALGREPWDAVIADYSMPNFDGLAALSLLQSAGSDAPFILVSGTVGEEVAVEAMKAGAQDYVMKSNLVRLPLALTHALREVDERRERRLAEARYRRLFETVPIGIFSSSSQGRILEANPAVAEILGVATAGELKRIDPRALWVCPEQRDELYKQLARESVVRNFEAQFRRPDASVVWCLITMRMVQEQGNADHYEGVMVDITERKRAQLELEERERELVRSNEDLQHFAYVASHDLREPLRMVAGFVDLLARRYRGRLDAAADEYIGYVVDGVRRMQQLIGSLLQYSRVGRKCLFAEFDLNQLVDSAIASLGAAISESGAIVSHETLPRVCGDADALRSVLMNLIANGIKFHREDAPVVKITAAESDGEWIISVSDNGIGIDPKYRESVFEMFRRLHSHAEFPGSGIGLAMCKRVVELHGGRIWIESVAGQGSTFRFTLPRQPQAATSDDA